MMRTSTPDRINPDGSRTITLQRYCNGCARSVGNATVGEFAACVGGGLTVEDELVFSLEHEPFMAVLGAWDCGLTRGAA